MPIKVSGLGLSEFTAHQNAYQTQWALWVQCTSKCLQETGKNKFSFDKYSNMYILVTCPIKKISINGNKNGQQRKLQPITATEF